MTLIQGFGWLVFITSTTYIWVRVLHYFDTFLSTLVRIADELQEIAVSLEGMCADSDARATLSTGMCYEERELEVTKREEAYASKTAGQATTTQDET